MDLICIAALLWQRLGENRRPGAAQPHCGNQEALSTMAWTPLLLMFLSLCTGRQAPGTRAQSQPHQPLACRLWEPFLQLLPHLLCVCVCRFPLPACADSASHPLCVSGSISQTHRHPEQWLQCWQLLHKLVPAEARESSLVPLYCYSDSNKHQGSRVPSHFFGSKDTSVKAGLLLISATG